MCITCRRKIGRPLKPLKEALLKALGISRMAAFQQNLKTFLMVNICEKYVVRSVMEFAEICVMFLHLFQMRRSRLPGIKFTTQSNIPVSNFVLLNSVDSLTFQCKVIAVELEVLLYSYFFCIQDCPCVI